MIIKPNIEYDHILNYKTHSFDDTYDLNKLTDNLKKDCKFKTSVGYFFAVDCKNSCGFYILGRLTDYEYLNPTLEDIREKYCYGKYLHEHNKLIKKLENYSCDELIIRKII